eukprot:jgi/Tetstr1/424629/TSEL_015151.t1
MAESAAHDDVSGLLAQPDVAAHPDESPPPAVGEAELTAMPPAAASSPTAAAPEAHSDSKPSYNRTDTMQIDSMGEDQLQTPLIVVAENFRPRPDAVLNSNLTLGKVLGTGFMGAVFDIKHADGSPANRVLKTLKENAGEEPRDLLEREMVIGRLLSQALGIRDEEGGIVVPGFMHVQAVVRHGGPKGKLLGIILEKVNSDSIGFHHRDLHLGNVMEHFPHGAGPKARMMERTLSLREVKRDHVKLSNTGWKVEFKIIDFGWAVADAVDPEDISKMMEEGAQTGTIGCCRCLCCIPNRPHAPKRPVKTGTAGAAPKADIPKMSFAARLYHRTWRGSSDCWRMLSSVAAVVDGMLWHTDDKEGVAELQDMLYQASGVYIRVRFTDKCESDVYKAKKFGRAWQARTLMRMTQGWANMAWAIAFPQDPGYTVEQALEHPFLKPLSAEAAAGAVSPARRATPPTVPEEIELVPVEAAAA